MDAATLAGHLEKHLRVSTFPLGIKSYKPGEALPERVKVPSKHLGVKVAICQAISIARRYGWSMAVSGEDISCPIAKATFGFEERIEYYTSGKLAEGMYASCGEAAAKFEEALSKYDFGEYAYIVSAPLARANFTPDTVLVYGNSAQVLRILTACLYKKGGSLKSDFSGRGDCTDIVIKGKKTGEPQVILPCNGDRVFGMTADDEMAFTFPFGMGEEVVEGLEKTHAGGIRYPIPIYLRFQAEYAKSYQELEKLWKEGGRS
ncbi:MAG TPA: DUF169 domain-containing protein [Candidatus Deferrimicrobiaceae bacterium]|nr:DUF169 domain-containing protein [Candidatus Deferrimicrobiaceae bacterium]